ncbi:hypothetical protein BLNAU_11212 [Blattamonas nauphoetae]|uniref:DDE-1 domain-containing protein n=1 Tax=Blattamonas nauphoetae TaxID=2049346 RepID=A0ABQ9XPZ5_9EUKA|nr:hypothetical protein BLNAU_11212 [Blattamonas nauphoetae]
MAIRPALRDSPALSVRGTSLLLRDRSLVLGTGPLFSFDFSPDLDARLPQPSSCVFDTLLISSHLVNMSSPGNPSGHTTSRNTNGQQIIGCVVSHSGNHQDGTAMLNPNSPGDFACVNSSFSHCSTETTSEDAPTDKSFTQGDRIENPNTFPIIFTRCTFSHMNSTSNGAAIYIYNYKSLFSINDCHFYRCISTAKWGGGAVRHFADTDWISDFTMNESSFLECNASCGANADGGSLAVSMNHSVGDQPTVKMITALTFPALHFFTFSCSIMQNLGNKGYWESARKDIQARCKEKLGKVLGGRAFTLLSRKHPSTRSECLLFAFDHWPQYYLGKAFCSDVAWIFRSNRQFLWHLRAQRNRRNCGQMVTDRKLTDEQEKELANEIVALANCHKPVGRVGIIKLVKSKHHIVVTQGWVHRFLNRHKTTLKRTIAKPMESSRSRLQKKMIRKYKARLQTSVVGVHPRLLFNCDESLLRKTPSVGTKKVIVKKEATNPRFKESSSKKVTGMLACIPFLGKPVKPLIVVKAEKLDPKVQHEVKKGNIEAITNVSSSGLIQADQYRSWISDQFIPHVRSVRVQQGLLDNTAVLLADNLEIHKTNEIKADLAANNIILFTFPPASSHLTQPCDQLTFTALKQMEKKDSNIHDATTQTHRFSEAALTLASCTDEKKNRLAFKEAGFMIKEKRGKQTVVLNDGRFDAMESSCIPDEEDTKKEKMEDDHNPTFGFVNRPQFPARWTPKFKQ